MNRDTTLIAASNALYRGEARGFLQAMDLVARQCRDEQVRNAQARREAQANPAEDDGQYLACLADSDRELEAYARLAGNARGVYLEELAAAHLRVLERLRARPEPELHDIADALEQDDYTELAI